MVRIYSDAMLRYIELVESQPEAELVRGTLSRDLSLSNGSLETAATNTLLAIDYSLILYTLTKMLKEGYMTL